MFNNFLKRMPQLSSVVSALVAGMMFGFALPASAQQTANRIEGLRDHTPRWHVLTDARIVLAPGRVIERGTLVMRDGVIVSVGADANIPAGARVWKMEGKTLYAGMIDLASQVGVPGTMRPAQASLPPWMRQPGMITPAAIPTAARASIAAQNRSVRAEQDVAMQLDWRADEVKAAREQGFSAVLASPSVGVFRGQSALLSLADSSDAKSVVLQSRVAQHMANEVDGGFRGGATYPASMMGAIALARQTLYDARWYGKALNQRTGERVEANAALESLQMVVNQKQPAIYVADSEQDYQRIGNIRDEFNLRLILQGNGFEYRRVAQLKQLAMPIIVPLNFPLTPEIENPDTAIDVSLESLQHWEQAPGNLAALSKVGIEFAVSTVGLRDVKEFWPQLRLAVKRGISADAALAALTTTPAKLIGATNMGTLEVGKLANIVVANGDLFTADTAEIEMLFVDGNPHVTPLFDRFDPRGTWVITVDGKNSEWKIAGTRARPTLSIDGAACDITLKATQLIVSLPCGKNSGDKLTEKQTIVANRVNDTMRGSLQSASSAATMPWLATKTAAFVEPTVKPKADDAIPAMANLYPAGAFGITPPSMQTVLIKNATIWTNAKAGKLSNADMLVRDGKIAAVGSNLTAPAGAVTIDAMGKHVTPGIIDAHSHTAVVGNVNEPTSSITAEVRIGDVIDATDINIYRQLAGGVTAANVLHGSANTIGGQNQVIKFRWGSDAEGLKYVGAKPGIKFALGENVKQANWGENSTTRYPQTRMGVEQILRDGFQAAQFYRQQWNQYRASPAKFAEPRRDLQLDTLVEILEKKRIVHIHSYRADEILMFVRIAQEFNFTVGTFQHVLEGYKVADAIASIGAGGSTFSDWWAYKMEVYDAIPTNAALMHRAGVVTTLNSDSNELARRLNTEAAKTVRYGGMSETDALKFVTLNAAKQLRIDDKVGSLEVGKDADFVIWNNSPLSSAVKAEQTWIEGRKYFDIATDNALRADAARERQRLIAKAMPMRMARLNTPSPRTTTGAPSGDAPSAVSPSVRDTLEYMAMQRWLHDAKQFRHSYWDGGNWHECTEDAK
jgi:imidazolonepropionase-like amidohydrolase